MLVLARRAQNECPGGCGPYCLSQDLGTLTSQTRSAPRPPACTRSTPGPASCGPSSGTSSGSRQSSSATRVGACACACASGALRPCRARRLAPHAGVACTFRHATPHAATHCLCSRGRGGAAGGHRRPLAGARRAGGACSAQVYSPLPCTAIIFVPWFNVLAGDGHFAAPPAHLQAAPLHAAPGGGAAGGVRPHSGSWPVAEALDGWTDARPTCAAFLPPCLACRASCTTPPSVSLTSPAWPPTRHVAAAAPPACKATSRPSHGPLTLASLCKHSRCAGRQGGPAAGLRPPRGGDGCAGGVAAVPSAPAGCPRRVLGCRLQLGGATAGGAAAGAQA